MRRSFAPSLAKTVFCVACLGVAACASLPFGSFDRLSRPSPLVGEWIDVSHTTSEDTALWVLRVDGYDGSARIRVTRNAAWATNGGRTDTRHGTWYLAGALTDSATRAICFARRLGRDGLRCLPFSLDTLTGETPRRRLTITGNRGAGDREFIERRPGSSECSPCQ
jgi:hypothetical protein